MLQAKTPPPAGGEPGRIRGVVRWTARAEPMEGRASGTCRGIGLRSEPGRKRFLAGYLMSASSRPIPFLRRTEVASGGSGWRIDHNVCFK